MSRFVPPIVLLTFALAALPGCDFGQPVRQPITPQRLSVSLFTRTMDRRMTYIEVHPNGDLRFGGGTEAVGRGTTLTRTLDPDQMNEIWTLIQRHNLLHGKQAGFLEKPEYVEYDLKINSREGDAGYRSLDDATPGLDKLQDLLFDLHAEVAYRVERVRQISAEAAEGEVADKP